ncbi:MAG: glycosyltransferase, partial [archaeon]
MKIALISDAIYPFSLGGSEIRNHEIAKRLVKKGHEVYIIGAKLWSGNPSMVMDGVKIEGIHKQELYSKNGKRNPVDSLILAIKLFNYLLKEKFDIIDTASFVYFNCYITKIISLLKGNGLVFTWHQYFGDYLRGYFGKLKGSIAMLLERLSLSLVKNNIVVSNHVKNQLIKRGLKEKNVNVIYNGVDLKMIRSIKQKRKIYDLIFVGRLNYQKNLPLLIKSIQRGRPKPVPFSPSVPGVVSPNSSVNNRLFLSSDKPIPLSSTNISTESPFFLQEIAMCPPCFVNLTAFDDKFLKIILKIFGSAKT